MEQLKKKPQVHNRRQWLSCGLGFIRYRGSKLDGRSGQNLESIRTRVKPKFYLAVSPCANYLNSIIPIFSITTKVTNKTSIHKAAVKTKQIIKQNHRKPSKGLITADGFAKQFEF